MSSKSDQIATIRFAGQLYIRKEDIVDILLAGAKNVEHLPIQIPTSTMLRALAEKVGELE